MAIKAGAEGAHIFQPGLHLHQPGVRLGEVVDFLDLYWGRYHWPAFNVADSLVCLGAGWLVWVILTEEKSCNASDPV